MAQRDNLYRRPSGIYVLRITVPVRYRALIGQREIHASIKASSTRGADINRKMCQTHQEAMWRVSIKDSVY